MKYPNNDYLSLIDHTRNKSELSLEEEHKPHYTSFKKYLILLIVALSAILAPLSSTIYFPSLEVLKHELKTTDTLIDLTISVYMLSLGILPLFWGGISDRYGRKGVFTISQIIYTLGNIGCALSNNINLLIGMRIIQGIGAAAPIVTGVGTITDIFDIEERGFAMSIFFVGPLVGPVVGPIIGGFLFDAFGWRSTFWCLTILGGILLILSCLFLPETLDRDSKERFPIQMDLWPIRIYKAGPFFNPLSPLKFLIYPIVLISCSCIALTFGSFFAMESSMSRVFPEAYKLTPSQSGLTFIPLGIGNILGNLIGGKVSDISFNRFKKRYVNPKPEVRLYGLWSGALLEAIGLLMTAWFVTYKYHLSIPLITSFFIGFGNTMSMIACSNYLVDNFPKFASSIAACFTSFQLIFTAILTSVNGIILEKLDYGITLSIYAGLCLVVSLTIFAMFYKGSNIRDRFGPYH